jgi:DNA repair protein RadA/Sms
MAKKTNYVCNNCGTVFLNWAGRCTSCKEWDCISEVEKEAFKAGLDLAQNVKNIKVLSLESDTESFINSTPRRTKFSEFDRALGGGVVRGGVYLIGGDPGVGKSTILLQVCAKIAMDGKNPDAKIKLNTIDNEGVYYISAEESPSQIQLRSKRLGIEKSPVKLISTTSIEDVLSTLHSMNGGVVVVDSVQTIYSTNIQSFAGSISQIRFCVGEIINIAKAKNISVFLVGHITKDGQIAGPKVLEHMVDAVLYFEGEKSGKYRVLRSIKNRYGPAGEIGLFEMSAGGFIDVENPSQVFLLDKGQGINGIVTFAGIEGTRVIASDIEALVSKSFIPMPRRNVVGFDPNRLSMLCAILDKHAGLKLFDKDIFLNIAGGMRVNETAADLAACVCIYSSLSNKIVDPNMICFGELSLSGQVRQVLNTEQRIIDSVKMGYKSIICPHFNGESVFKDKLGTEINIKTVTNIKELLSFL